MIDARRVHSVFTHLEGVIDEVVRVAKADQTDRDEGLFLWVSQKVDWVICASNQINEPIVYAT